MWPVGFYRDGPRNFWLWRHLKTVVYSEPISDLEMIQQQIESVSQKVKVRPEIFERVGTSVRQELKVVLTCMRAT